MLQNSMAKTLVLADDVYLLLKSMKRKDESFSDVIRRICGEENQVLRKGRKIDLSKWLGIFKQEQTSIKNN